MDTISIISLTIGVASFASSIVFYIQARGAEKSDREILDNIHKAINEWQSRIMESAIEMLESRTEIIAKRKHLEDTKAKNDFLRSLTENINHIIEHFASSENTKAQLAELNMLLGTCNEIIKSYFPAIPPEILEKYLVRDLLGPQNQADTQKDQTKDDPDQPSKG